MDDVIFVTGNADKAARFAMHIGMDIKHQPADLDEIQTLNPAELVGHKARQAYQQIGKPVLVEDVTFTYEALGDLPGPFVKFFVEVEDGVEKMCRLLDGFDNRQAEARCTFGYFDGHDLRIFSGSISGTVTEHPRGESGYGFDRVFAPDGFDGRTAGELSDVEYDKYYTTIKPFGSVRDFLMEQYGG